MKSHTHPDNDCDNIKLGGQGTVEEDVHRRHCVDIHPGISQCCSEPSRTK
jgi:hypothetical protein